MKTKLSVISLLAIFAVIFSVSCSAKSASDDLKKIEGKWKYSMPDMNGGTVESTCVIKTVDGETKATMSSPMGDISTSPLTLKEGKYVGEISFEGGGMGTFKMEVSFEPKDGKLLYSMKADFGGDMPQMPPIEMTRVEEK